MSTTVLGSSAAIALSASDIDEGTTRMTCPVCNAQDEQSLVVTRQGALVKYICHRASCGARGVTSDRSPMVRAKRRAPKAPKIFTNPLASLSERERKLLKDRIGFNAWHLGVANPMLDESTNRIAFPIYGPMGMRRGWLLRSYDYSAHGPKALTRMDVSDEPHLAWYRVNPSSSRVIVVEDIPSAVRASRHLPQAVAMLGAGIGPDYVNEICQFARHIVWAFDADATVQAFEHHRKYSNFFESSQVLPLKRDLKDMDEHELSDTIRPVSI